LQNWSEKPTKKRVENRVEILKPEMSLQGEGYRLGSLFRLNLASLIFGVLYFLSGFLKE
jgi:hypothetical protein